jgi:glycosyltransferase involved in cell wall biosynthesis
MPIETAGAPALSVVTPSYGQLEWLRMCAASVADQSGVSVEHLVQDAGTGEALEAWAATRPGLRLFVEPDEGMYDAVNRGLRRARGAICAYLNCDEQYLPGVLAEVAALFEKRPDVDVLFGDAVLLDSSGEPFAYRRVVLPDRVHTRLAIVGTLTCAMFFRRTLFERGYEFNPAWKAIGDAEWVDRLLRDRIRMAVIRKPLAAFTMTGANLGESPLARDEYAIWRREAGAPPAWLTGPAVLLHRLRKLLAGAYLRRAMPLALYTRDCLAHRTPFAPARLGFRWASQGSAACSKRCQEPFPEKDLPVPAGSPPETVPGAFSVPGTFSRCQP